MRVLIIIIGLVVALTLAALAWLSTQVTAQSILGAISQAIEKDGLEMSHDGPSSLSIFPDTFLEISQVSVIIPESDDGAQVSIELTGLRFETSVLSLLRSPKGYLSVKSLTVDDITLSNLATEVFVKDSVTLPNLSAQLWQGVLNGKVVIDSGDDNVVIKTEGRLDNADASEVLTSLANVALLSGALSLNWNLEIIPPEGEHQVAQVNGNVDASGEAITFDSVDLERSICNAVALAEGRRVSSSISGQTVFTRFNTSQTLSGSDVRIDELILATSGMSVSGKGMLDRASTAFTADAVSNLNATKMNQRSDCQISSRISEIEWPVTCKGTTDTGDPGSWCRVDVSSIAEQILKARIKDKLKLDDDSNLFKSLLERIR
jgi:hypothetical protein